MPNKLPVIPPKTPSVPVINVDPLCKNDPVKIIVSILVVNTLPTLPDILTEPVTPRDPVI